MAQNPFKASGIYFNVIGDYLTSKFGLKSFIGSLNVVINEQEKIFYDIIFVTQTMLFWVSVNHSYHLLDL